MQLVEFKRHQLSDPRKAALSAILSRVKVEGPDSGLDGPVALGHLPGLPGVPQLDRWVLALTTLKSGASFDDFED